MSLKALYGLSFLMVDINQWNKLSATDCYIVIWQINEITQEYTGNMGINNTESNKWGKCTMKPVMQPQEELGGTPWKSAICLF